MSWILLVRPGVELRVKVSSEKLSPPQQVNVKANIALHSEFKCDTDSCIIWFRWKRMLHFLLSFDSVYPFWHSPSLKLFLDEHEFDPRLQDFKLFTTTQNSVVSFLFRSSSGQCDPGEGGGRFLGARPLCGGVGQLSLSGRLWYSEPADPSGSGLSWTATHLRTALPLPLQSCESFFR